MDTAKTLVLPPPNTRPDLGAGSIFFVGNATVILRYAGFTILTDPNFLHKGDHVHLGFGLRSARLTDPALDLDDLPPIDFVVLSHLHEDHFDRLVEERLDKDLPIVTTPQATIGLRAKGFRALHAIGTWETFTAVKGAARLDITAMPGRHGPGPLTALLPSVMGSMLEFRPVDDAIDGTSSGEPTLRLYLTGDTLIHDALRAIPTRYPAIDLALLHLGGTRILGVTLTMDAAQGVEMLRIVAPRRAIPIHYEEYTVMRSPLDDFKRAVEEAGLADRVDYLDHGDTYEFTVPAERIPSGTSAGQAIARLGRLLAGVSGKTARLGR